MKVCIITLSHKGMIHYSSQLVNAVSKMNDLTYMVTAENADPYLFHRNVKIYRVPWPDRFFNLKSLRFDVLIKHIRTINPDVIHFSIEHPWTIPCILFLKLKKIPVVGTLHDVRKHPGDWNPVLNASLEFLKFSCDVLIVHSNTLKTDLMRSGIKGSKIKVIPHGNYEFFTRFKRSNMDETNSILFFGRMVRYKGLEYLLSAIPSIVKELPDLKIVIAGEGSLIEYTDLIERHRPFLEIHNYFIKDQNVAELFQRSKLVVLPYIEASQSGIVHIAYAFKKPVVATKVGALPEVVENGKTGLLVPPRDTKRLAGSIIKLLKDDSLRKEMGEQAYKKMKEEMAWDDIAEKTIGVYKDAIGKKLI